MCDQNITPAPAGGNNFSEIGAQSATLSEASAAFHPFRMSLFLRCFQQINLGEQKRYHLFTILPRQ